MSRNRSCSTSGIQTYSTNRIMNHGSNKQIRRKGTIPVPTILNVFVSGVDGIGVLRPTVPHNGFQNSLNVIKITLRAPESSHGRLKSDGGVFGRRQQWAYHVVVVVGSERTRLGWRFVFEKNGGCETGCCFKDIPTYQKSKKRVEDAVLGIVIHRYVINRCLREARQRVIHNDSSM